MIVEAHRHDFPSTLLLLLLVPVLSLLGGSIPAYGRDAAPRPAAADPAGSGAWIDLTGLNFDGALAKLSSALERVPQTDSRDSLEAAYRRFAEDSGFENSAREANRAQLAREFLRTSAEANFYANALQQRRIAVQVEMATLDGLRLRKAGCQAAFTGLRESEREAFLVLEGAVLGHEAAWLVLTFCVIPQQERALIPGTELVGVVDSLVRTQLSADDTTPRVLRDTDIPEEARQDSVVRSILAGRQLRFRRLGPPLLKDIGPDSVAVLLPYAVRHAAPREAGSTGATPSRATKVKVLPPIVAFDAASPKAQIALPARLGGVAEISHWVPRTTQRLQRVYDAQSKEAWRAEIGRARDNLGRIGAERKKAAEELRTLGSRITAQESLLGDLQRELDAFATQSADADKRNAAAEEAINQEAMHRTVRLYPSAVDQMIDKVREAETPPARQGAKLQGMLGKLRAATRSTYLRESDSCIDSSSAKAYFNEVRYGEPGGSALGMQRGRVFCKYYDRQKAEIGVGLALEVQVDVGDNVLRRPPLSRAVVATAVVDAAARTARTGRLMYKHLDAGPLGMTYTDALGKLSEANQKAQESRTNWRIPEPGELLELRDTALCGDDQTPCCVFPALAARGDLRYWTSDRFEAAPGFNKYRTVSFSRARLQSEETPETSGCGLIIVSTN